ncbi:hypothetical protein TNCV_1468391 [Trichonephila clavipes]|uniref:Uncharacterized protein n=1 Tax=Trichonephila clavipes TaxID=2585209 RepID=A0A8X6S4I5_TRICX|nr:hypothetical protein TNCV_1468391 [Trichonephila clavipes]
MQDKTFCVSVYVALGAGEHMQMFQSSGHPYLKKGPKGILIQGPHRASYANAVSYPTEDKAISAERSWSQIRSRRVVSSGPSTTENPSRREADASVVAQCPHVSVVSEFGEWRNISVSSRPLNKV